MDTKTVSRSDAQDAASSTTTSEGTLCGETTSDEHAKDNSDAAKENSEHAEKRSDVHLNTKKHQSLRSTSKMDTKTVSRSDAQDAASLTTTSDATLCGETTSDDDAKENSAHTENSQDTEKRPAVYPNNEKHQSRRSTSKMDTKTVSRSDAEDAASATTTSEASLCADTTCDEQAKDNSDDTEENSKHVEKGPVIHLYTKKHESRRYTSKMDTKTISRSDAQDAASATTNSEATNCAETTSDDDANENSDATKENSQHAEKRSAVYPNIGTPAQQQEFLRELHKPFLANVDPVHSGLIDQLFQDDLLCGSDYSSLRETKGRRQQVRDLWPLFVKMKVEDFCSLVFPWLYKEFHHIIPTRFCSEEPVKISTEIPRLCLRHLLMKQMKPAKFLDLLYENGCVSEQWFSEFASNIPKMMSDSQWKRLFDVGRNSDVSPPWLTLEKEIKDYLIHFKCHIPQDLRKQLSLGVPCACLAPAEDFSPELSSSEETERSLQTQRDFQAEGSQYLGSDDPDIKYSHQFGAHSDRLGREAGNVQPLVVAIMTDPLYLSWARGEGLPDIILWKLLKEGITNKEELRSFSQYELNRLRFKLNLSRKEVDLVSKAIRTLKDEASPNASLQDFFETTDEPCQGNKRLSLPGSRTKVKIILVGKTGSGKSSSGNTILGKDGGKFDQCLSMSSQTRECQFDKSSNGTVEVIDCPGLFDTCLSMNAACEIIMQAFVAMHPRPDVCLYVLKIGDKYTAEEYGTYKRLKAIFGRNITRIMIILFTRGDDLDKRGITIEEYIETAPKTFKHVLKECNHRYVVFDNTPSGANREQLRELWARIQQVKDQDRSSTEDRFSAEAVSRFSSNKTKRRREVRRHLGEVLKDEYEAKQRFMHAKEKPEHMQELIRLLRRFLHQIAQFFMGEIGETDC